MDTEFAGYPQFQATGNDNNNSTSENNNFMVSNFITNSNGSGSGGGGLLDLDETKFSGGGGGAFASLLATKRRRMRSVSGGAPVDTTMASDRARGVSTGGHKKANTEEMAVTAVVTTTTTTTEKKKEEPNNKKEKDGKCKGATTIPIFLKKTYKMIDTCDPTIAGWTADGDMFVVKDPDLFASTIIPQYFDHNKFSSFARQLNFYGFRKMQSKPIRNADFDVDTAKHVTFYNEKFKRGRCDLLKEIQRSTRGGGSTATLQDHQREVEALKKKVQDLEHVIEEMNTVFEEKLRNMELNMLGRMEQVVLAMQQVQNPRQSSTAGPTNTGASTAATGTAQSNGEIRWDPLPLQGDTQNQSQTPGPPQSFRNDSNSSMNPPPQKLGPTITAPEGQTQQPPAPSPTLPPHPKQKQLKLPESMRNGSITSLGMPGRLTSELFARGLSTGSNTSGIILRNSWEDKFFSMLMLGDNEAGAGGHQISNAGGPALSGPASDARQTSGPISDVAMAAAISAAADAAGAPPYPPAAPPPAPKQESDNPLSEEKKDTQQALDLATAKSIPRPSRGLNSFKREGTGTFSLSMSPPPLSPSPSHGSISSVSSEDMP